MASQQPVIQVDQLSKRFRLYEDRRASLKDLVVRGSLGKWKDLWALRDVSFNVPKGQSLGVIGQNGSGKSTLLKVLTGIIYPDGGSVHVEGRVSALLELGAGFQPEYSGRENIYLYGALLGLSRSEVRKRYDEIVEFSELGDFVEYPVKNYSSGMYMRLGFAVAVHLDPDVLLIDEVLAVGDAAFAQKCFAHLHKMKKAGKTIVLVTHDADSVLRFCERAIWLDHGELLADGPSEYCIQRYTEEAARRASERRHEAPPGSAGNRDRVIDITAVRTLDADGAVTHTAVTGAPLTLEIDYEAHRDVSQVAINVTVLRDDGVRCVDAPSNTPSLFSLPRGTGTARLHFPRFTLGRGAYLMTIAVYDPIDHAMYQFHDRLYPLSVQDPMMWSAVVTMDYDWRVGALRSAPEEVRDAG